LTPSRRPRVLLLVENLSVPFDRRVWREARALDEAGLEVTVICPQGDRRDTEPEAVIEGIRIRRFPLKPSGGGALGFIREFASACWRSLRLAWRDGPFDAIHVANPPDVLFSVALPFRLLGAKFVYDQHDLAPELFEARFDRRGPLYWLLRGAEWISYRLASLVISTNESYRRIAMGRGGKAPGEVVVVRNGPELSRLELDEPDEELKRGKPHLLCYLGVMGPQDGVDLAVRALHRLRQVRRDDDWHAVFIGDGESLPSLARLAEELGLREHVTFTGFLDDELNTYLATADLGLVPDPKSSLNDVSTLVKVMEYMALRCPIVSFDLEETRFSAQDAGLYVPGDDPGAFAEAIDRLLDDPERRARMAQLGRRRVVQELSWEHSKERLIGAYHDVLGLGDGLTKRNLARALPETGDPEREGEVAVR
jgi:glycosyltransferase involved in cell wall biosynthesis